MHRLFFPYLFLLVVSCQETSTHLPPGKMQGVLEDIHLAEAYSSMVARDSGIRTSQKNNDSLASYYQLILEHHKLSANQFEESLKWYKQHPEELDSIYAKMIDHIAVLQAKSLPKP
ncbi:MAG TPA: DUF4296 domain-containing protein [Flavipsychrobacter sp.]|nr:DUF4296 domain-containing protein [Flavipsychrobacter sp.]